MGGNLAKELLSLALFALPDGHLRLLPGRISGRYQRRPVAIQANLLRRLGASARTAGGGICEHSRERSKCKD
jgi:hypothetical protein